MSRSLSIDDTILDNPNDQPNLEDFTWSITSAGPDDNNIITPVSSDRIPSVHIANRVEGSVCLTPSDCTSFGPSDYALSSPASSTYRLPSPDIAYRMFENAPHTPSTATTWGVPTETPRSSVFSRPPSVDLGERMIFSRPVTPTTATSWGPPSWPSSPAYTEYTSNSIHMCDRCDFSRPVTPSTALSWGAPLSSPHRPATSFYVTGPDARHHEFRDTRNEPRQSLVALSPIINANDSCLRASIDCSWSYCSIRPTPQRSLYVPSIYPYLVIYQPVYSYFDLYPGVPGVALEKGTSTGYLDSSVYSPILITGDTLAQRAISVRLTPCYPVFELYPAIYPDNLYRIYQPINLSTSVDFVSTYQSFDIYPDSSSVLHQLAPVTRSLDIETQEVQRYSHLDLFDGNASGYPKLLEYLHSNLCPTTRSIEPMKNISLQTKTHLSIAVYPLSTTSTSRPAECETVRPTYSDIVIYPAMYPALEIYPRTVRVNDSARKVDPRMLDHPPIDIQILPRKSLSVQAASSYPVFNLYPSVHAFLDIYPALSHDIFKVLKLNGSPCYESEHSPKIMPLDTAGQSKHAYPIFIIYPAVYPYFDLYPIIAGTAESEDAVRLNVDTIAFETQTNYPAFNPDPHFEPWPSMELPKTDLMPNDETPPLQTSSWRASSSLSLHDLGPRPLPTSNRLSLSVYDSGCRIIVSENSNCANLVVSTANLTSEMR